MVSPLKPRKLFLAVLVSALSTPLLAKTNDLVEIYNLAVTNDAEFAAARAELMAGQEADNQGLAGLLPVISASAYTGYNDYENLNEDRNGLEDGGFNIHGWGASLTQPIFELEKWFTYQRSKSETTLAEYQFEVAEQDLILRVAEGYFNVLDSEDAHATALAQQKAFKRQLEEAEQRFEVGLVAKTDVLDAKARYENSRSLTIIAQNNIRLAYENLRTLTGEKQEDLATLEKEMPVVEPEPNDRGAWVDTAMQNNKEIKVANQQVESARENVNIQRSGHAPTVNGVIDFAHDVTHDPRLPPPSSGKTDNTIYSLELSMPLFTGGGTRSRVRQSGHELDQFMQLQEFVQRTTYETTRNLFNTVNSDVLQVEARWQGYLAAEAALESTRSGYEVGTRNAVDLLDAQQDLFQAVANYLSARYAYILDTLRLKRAAGTLSPEDILALNNWLSEDNDSLIPALSQQ